MILNCAIIDEDPEALALLKHYVEETPSLNLIGAYHNAIEAVDGKSTTAILTFCFLPSTCSRSADSSLPSSCQ